MFNAVVALGNAVWEAQFVSALSHPMTAIHVFRRCVDGVDIRATVQVHQVDVVLVSDDTLRIDAGLIVELNSAGVRVVALSSDTTFWTELGAVECVSVDVTNIPRSISSLVNLLNNQQVDVSADDGSQGDLVAVAGFGGGVGRSLVLRELGFACAGESMTTVCVEADTFGPSMSQDLNLPIDTLHLLDMCQLIHQQELQLKDSSDSVINRLAIVADNLAVIPGIPRSSQWIDLRTDAINKVYRQLRQDFDVTVVDVGPVVELEFGIGGESALPRRQASAIPAIEQADYVVLCVRADVVSVTRLVKTFLELSDIFSHAEIHVVINQVRDRRSTKDFEKSIRRYTGITSIFTVDDCYSDVSKALKAPTFIGGMNPQSNMARTMHDIAKRLLARSTVQKVDSKLSQLISRSDVA